MVDLFLTDNDMETRVITCHMNKYLPHLVTDEPLIMMKQVRGDLGVKMSASVDRPSTWGSSKEGILAYLSARS